MMRTHRRKHSTGASRISVKDAPKTEQILFRVTPERKRQLSILLAERGQKIQSFMERNLEAALAQAEREQN